MINCQNNIKLIGKHAHILQKYSKDKGNETNVMFELDNNSKEKSSVYLFERRIDGYMICAMLGLINDIKAEIDNGNKYKDTVTIFLDVMNKERSNLNRIYQHMILSRNSTESVDQKIKNTFSEFSSEKMIEETKNLEFYVRGGLEFIDEKFSECTNYETFCEIMCDLLNSLKIEEEI